MPFVLLFSFLVLLSSNAASKVVDVNLASFLNSNSIYRGALTWEEPSFFIGPSFVFYKKLSVRGPALVYSSFKRESSFVLNYSYSFFNDRRPFATTTSREENFRNSRSSSMHLEVHSGYKFGFMNLFEFGSKLSYEFKEYKAWYIEPYVNLPVAPYVRLNLKLGVGEGESNRYLYGETAVSGVGYSSIGLSGFVPLSKGRLILTLDHVSVLKAENRNAFLVGEKPENLNLAIRYFVKIY